MADMKKKLIIEARMIEYEMRDRNPDVPWTPEEIASDAAACRCAGAAIVHFHARTPDGAPEPRVDITKEIIRRLRESSDILIGPALGSLNRQ
jgi:3-keto-5-aminohexanoate cleavage enzyme